MKTINYFKQKYTIFELRESRGLQSKLIRGRITLTIPYGWVSYIIVDVRYDSQTKLHHVKYFKLDDIGWFTMPKIKPSTVNYLKHTNHMQLHHLIGKNEIKIHPFSKLKNKNMYVDLFFN